MSRFQMKTVVVVAVCSCAAILACGGLSELPDVAAVPGDASGVDGGSPKMEAAADATLIDGSWYVDDGAADTSAEPPVQDGGRDDTTSPGADAAVDAEVLVLVDGVSGDGSCPADLKTGFVRGTEVCASAPTGFDGGDVTICLPMDDAGRARCPGASTWLIGCNPGHAPVGQAPEHPDFSMGSYDCYQLATPLPGDRSLGGPPNTCCTQEPSGTLGVVSYFGYFLYGSLVDTDGDLVPDLIDNCPAVPNPDQIDTDLDGVGDVCDNCPDTYNPNQKAALAGGVGDACNCSFAGVLVGANACPCTVGGTGSSIDAGNACRLVVGPDGGVSGGV